VTVTVQLHITNIDEVSESEMVSCAQFCKHT